ncbi:hypothetical protein AB0K62_13480 [Streptomyces halstedii]|uniref:hypothetical protein n=1 Tax=Streptomyces halstedii TaxID=1944 RepID=UPI00345FEA82
MTEYEVSCLRKTRFLTRRTGGPALRAYHCTKWCGLWHLGHRPGTATYTRTTPQGPIHIQELTQ